MPRTTFQHKHLGPNLEKKFSLIHNIFQGFAVNSRKTIAMLRPELETLLGQRLGFTYYDEVAMNLAYDCADGCTDNCENNGYVRKVNGVCTCFCPPYVGQ